jgi:hypothetical protein
LRERVPREKHAGWAARKGRPDPIDLLIKSNATRLPNLIPIRYGRMLTSAFAFLRGSAAVMASDLSRTPKTGIWVQACGDCHLMNFGAFATPEQQLIFDINDFDETLPAPWEWDLKRLAASFAVAGKYINLSRRDASAASKSAGGPIESRWGSIRACEYLISGMTAKMSSNLLRVYLTLNGRSAGASA